MSNPPTPKPAILARIATILCLIFLTVSASAEKPDVSEWQTYTAPSAPSFRIAFPAEVKVVPTKSGHIYSSTYRWNPHLATQILVSTGILKNNAADMDSDAAMELYTSKVAGKIGSKQIVQIRDGFALVYTGVSVEDELIVTKQHNIYFIDKNLYVVEHCVLASVDTPKEQVMEAVNLAPSVLKTFVPLK